MNTAYLLTGGNLGNRAELLARAKSQIVADGNRLLAESAIFETAAWGVKAQPSFLNQALKINTTLSAVQLLTQTQAIENKLGRIRKQRYGPRLIDIDILFFNDEIVQTPELKIPHPELVNRRFALKPLASIAEDFLHPVLNKTIAELLSETKDHSEVKEWNGKK